MTATQYQLQHDMFGWTVGKVGGVNEMECWRQFSNVDQRRSQHSICDWSCRRRVSVRRCSCCICCMRSRCRARFCGMG